MHDIKKYPRTQHLEGSKLQAGDHDLEQVALAAVAGKYMVGEEKLDAANAGLSFAAGRELLLQCRGHYLTGGSRYEAQFDLFKPWANAHAGWLWDALGTRYILFGEWMYAKHTIYYDALPHYFMAFGVWDREEGKFLSEALRTMMFDGCPLVWAPVVHRGPIDSRQQLESLVGPSAYKTPDWREHLLEDAAAAGYRDPDLVLEQTDMTDLMEGVYFYIEDGDFVTDLLKWVRHGFVSLITDNEEHWGDRPMIVNRLRPDVDLYAY